LNRFEDDSEEHSLQHLWPSEFILGIFNNIVLTAVAVKWRRLRWKNYHAW